MLNFVDWAGGRRRSFGSFGALLVFGVIAPAAAVSADDAAHLAPVASLIDAVEDGFGGRILMIELAQTPAAAGPARYDVKLLTDDGNVLRLHYDARTLQLEAVEGRDDGARAAVDDEQEAEDEVKREDADEIERENDHGGGTGDNSGSGSGDDNGGSDSSGSGSGGSGGDSSGSSGSSGSGSGGSGGSGSDDGPDHN